MKRIALIFFAVLFSAVTCVYAADNPPLSGTASDGTKITVRNPAEKLNRGLINIVTSPIEIAKQVNLSWQGSSKTTKDAGSSLFSGFFKGLGFTVMRMGSGLWDVISFPFKNPSNYEPLMKPEFVLDEDKPKTK